jgi:hypothetical protein
MWVLCARLPQHVEEGVPDLNSSARETASFSKEGQWSCFHCSHPSSLATAVPEEEEESMARRVSRRSSPLELGVFCRRL